MSLFDNAFDIKNIIGDRLLPIDVVPAFDMDMEILAARARDILTLASATLNAAYDNLAEAPEDVADASAAVAAAKEAETRISAMAKDKHRGNDARGVATSLLSTASATLNQAAIDVDAHESGNSSASAKRTAHEASLQESKSKKGGAPASKRPAKHAAHDDDDERTVAAQRLKRFKGEHDDNDERDNSVGQGKHRRPRKATSEFGRKTTRVLSGLLDEGSADEVVSTVGTGALRLGEGAGAVFSGDHQAVDRTGLVYGRGTKNTLRDLGFDKETAQAVGHTVTVMAQTTGHTVATVRNGVVAGAVAVKETAVAGGGAVQDAAASTYRYFTGEPEPKLEPKPAAPIKVTLNGIGTGSIAAAAKALKARGVDLDSDDDGKVTIGEVKASISAWNKSHPKPTHAK